MKATPERPLTTQEFATEVSRKPWTIRQWARDGIVVSVKTRGVILIPRSEVERFTTPGVKPKPGPKTRASLRQNNR